MKRLVVLEIKECWECPHSYPREDEGTREYCGAVLWRGNPWRKLPASVREKNPQFPRWCPLPASLSNLL